MKQFITEREPDRDGMLILDGKAYIYLIKVRRMRIGDILPVMLPGQRTAHMVIESIADAKKQLKLKMLPYSIEKKQNALFTGALPNCSSIFQAEQQQNSAPTAKIILLQWVLKGSKTDMIVRQAAEAGVHAVLPVLGAFSVAKKQSPAQLERYRRIIKEARQQSGSLVDTIIEEPAPLTDILKNLPQFISRQTAVLGMCSEANEKSTGLHKLLATKPSYVVLAIGAEGGISPAEMIMLSEAGFQTIHFNTNILRAETAAIYAIAAVQTIISEADQWQLPV